jgi:hypothetical protein
MKVSFKTQSEVIEIDTDKMEAYFRRDDMIATLRMSDEEIGYFLFEHPLWLQSYRVRTDGRRLEKLLWVLVGDNE